MFLWPGRSHADEGQGQYICNAKQRLARFLRAADSVSLESTLCSLRSISHCSSALSKQDRALQCTGQGVSKGRDSGRDMHLAAGHVLTLHCS